MHELQVLRGTDELSSCLNPSGELSADPPEGDPRLVGPVVDAAEFAVFASSQPSKFGDLKKKKFGNL